MSKSRARLLAELLNSAGRVKKDKSDLAGEDSIIDLDSLPTITNAKLENSSISIAGHSTALGGTVTLDTGDIGEHENYKYYTDARVDARIVNAGSANWNTAYGWGNHASGGYSTLTSNETVSGFKTFTNASGIKYNGAAASPLWLNRSGGTNVNIRLSSSSSGTTYVGQGASAGTLKVGTTADLIGAGNTVWHTGTLTTTNKANYDTAYGWGNHASAGYLTSHQSLSSLLPKTGGTLTGALTGTTARFSGVIHLGATATANDQFAVNNGTDIFIGTSAKGLRTYKDLHTNSGNNKYWHAGNDGANSGLDADLLDAQHGSYYLNYNNFTNKPTIPSLSGYATESYVGTQISNLVDSSPAALNTLNELAAALGDDENFSTTVTDSIATKLPLAGGTITGNITFGTNTTDGQHDIQVGSQTTSRGIRLAAYTTFGTPYSNWDTWIGTNTRTAVGTTSSGIRLATSFLNAGASALNLAFAGLNFYTWTAAELSGKTAGSTLTLGTAKFSVSQAGNGSFAGTISSGAITSSGTITGTQFLASGSDTTPAGTTFANTVKGVGTHRTMYFDGDSDSVSTWYGVGNNPYGAIDVTEGLVDIWVNPSDGSWYNVADFSTGGLRISSGERVSIDSSSSAYYKADGGTNYWKYLSLQTNGASNWDIATKNNELSGALQFRPGGGPTNRTYMDTSGNWVFGGTITAPHVEGTIDFLVGSNYGTTTNPDRLWISQFGTGQSDVPGAYHDIINLSSSSTHGVQIASGYGASSGGLYMRTRSDNNSAPAGAGLQAWNKLWHSNNDGANSGLHADLLDGQHGSYYRSASNLNAGRVPNAQMGTMLNTSSGSAGTLRLESSNELQFYNASGSYAHLYINYKGSDTNISGTNLFVPRSGSITRAGNTVWDAGNDGPSSGLDADTVDGKHKDFLMHYKGMVSGNWDSIFSQTDGHMGVYEVHNITNTASNYPSGAYAYGGVMSWQLDNSTFKMYAPHTGSLYIQNGWNNDEYSGWRKVWDSGNDGPSSGLDADLLDGEQGSYYASASSLGSYLPLAGGTLTGTLTTGGNIAVPSNTGISTSGDWVKMTTSHGYIQIGPANSGHAHIYTDRSNFYFNKTLIYAAGHSMWHAGNDGVNSGLDADTVDTLQASQFLRSDTADTGSGKVTLTATEGLEVGGIRGRPIGDQSGDFIQLYERVNIGYPSGWGASAAAAPSYGLSTHGGAQFNKGNVSGAPFTFNSNTIWHAGNDGSGSGLDADTLDGYHKSEINPAHSHYRWTGISASGTTARRFVIMRLYGCPAHWDSSWQDIHLKVWSESYEATNLKYEICGDYNGGNQNTMFQLRLKDAGGSSEHSRFRLVLGTPVDAGWDHSGQNTYYVDVYAEASHYMNFSVAADFYSAGFNVNTLPTSGGATSVVYSSPSVSNITAFIEAKEHSYFANHKIWNDGNHGSASGLDADLLDGQHGSYYAPAANYLPLAGGTLTGNLNGTTASFSGKVDFQGTAAIEGGTAGAGYGVFKGYSPNDNHFIAVRGAVATGSSTPNLTGAHQTTFVEHAENNDTTGWYWKSRQTGTYQEIARLTRTGGFKRAGNQVWDSGNDGVNSGLDADTVDTLQASQFLRSDASDSVTAGVTYTWGNSDAAALVVGRSTGNAEKIHIGGWSTTNSSNIHRIRGSSNLHIDSADNGDIYLNYYNSNNPVRMNGDNIAWHSGNDGSGSGLDADTVDGLHYVSHLGLGKRQTITVYGDTDKYYPIIISGNAGHVSTYKIHRAYSEHGPNDWNTASHKGGLSFMYNIMGSSGWGGYPTRIHVIEAGEIYASILGGIALTAHTMKHVVWLRGGGSGGGRYHIDSNSDFTALVSSLSTDSHYKNSTDGWYSYDHSNAAYDVTVNYRTQSQRNTAMQNEIFSNMDVYYGNGKVNHQMHGAPAPSKTYIYSSDNYVTIPSSIDISSLLNFYNRNNTTKRIYFNTNGDIYATGNITAYSDIALKENIEVIPNALEKVDQIRGVTFTRKDDTNNKRYSGVIAQEIEKVLPEVVETTDEGTKSVAYGNMVGLLIEAVKELKQEVEDLKTQLKER